MEGSNPLNPPSVHHCIVHVEATSPISYKYKYKYKYIIVFPKFCVSFSQV